ncbi:MAG: TIGR02281 family clan AA aspartic protease [Bacteroidales bacterium]|nr:TIGR02281 family clan AA aspartic protease [Bacteroidales bacterium]
MKKILSIISAAVLILLPLSSSAQKKTSSEDDYNLRKAYEVLREENDLEKGLDLVNKQLSSTPDNVKALILRADLLRRTDESGKALNDINHALKVNKPKKSGTPTSTLYWWKGIIYDDLDQMEESVSTLENAYSLAKKDNPENLEEIAYAYAQALYLTENYSSSDNVFREVLSKNETAHPAMVGLARNMLTRGEYKDALSMLDKAEKFTSENSQIYYHRMRAHYHLGENAKAIDDGLVYYEMNDNPYTDTLSVVLRSRPSYAEASIKTMIKESSSPSSWMYFLAQFYEMMYRYKDAIKTYDRLENEYGKNTLLNIRRADCYSEVGFNEKAIAEMDKVIEEEPDANAFVSRGDYYRLLGDYDKAIEDFTRAIEESPKWVFPYYRRGWCYEFIGEREKALEDYNVGIEVDDEYPYLYLRRGEIYLIDGKKEAAENDFNRILQIDTLMEYGSCRQYALYFLGRDDEALEWMEGLIALDPDDAGPYYDKACLLSRMGRGEESVSALKTAFEKGYRDFAHLRIDDDMDPVRDLPSFKALVSEWESKHAEEYMEFMDEEKATEESSSSEGALYAEIPIKRHRGGTFEIPCSINGLPLQMIFDTGASDITISSVEANFMLKNGYLSDRDVKGKRYYRIADGQISEGTVITLREVKIGETVLKNVDASVVKSQEAPLLLGQSAMERFGKITIDNENLRIVIQK